MSEQDSSFDDESETAQLARPQTTSSSSSSSRPSSTHNLLSLHAAAALLVAENVGTGVLGIPGFVHTLGWTYGIAFVLLQIPLNLFAGSELDRVATNIEDNDESKTKQR